MRRFVQAAGILSVALFMMVASASAMTIQFNTNAAGTGFVVGGSGLTLTGVGSGGATGNLIATPYGNVTLAVPPVTGVSYGSFDLNCTGCTTQAVGTGYLTFPAFTFDIVLTDVTNSNVTGTFVGTSPGGKVFTDASPLVITWTPTQFGPGGLWNGTTFTLTSPSFVPAPTSGLGTVTVQGSLMGGGVPEPATFLLLGSALLGFGILRRKRA